MDRLLKEECKRSLFTYKMAFVIVFMYGIALRVLISNYAFSYGRSEVFLYADCFAASGMSYFIALFAVIPYSTIFCSEYNSGYIKHIILKTGFKGYFKHRMVGISLSGSIAIGISLILIFATILIIGNPYSAQDTKVLGNGIWYKVINQGGIYWYFALKLLLGMIYGAVWAMCGFAASTWFTNKYVALLTPLVINLSLWSALGEYPHLNPLHMFRGDYGLINEFTGTFTYIFIFQFTLLILFVIISYFGMKRRLRDV